IVPRSQPRPLTPWPPLPSPPPNRERGKRAKSFRGSSPLSRRLGGGGRGAGGEGLPAPLQLQPERRRRLGGGQLEALAVAQGTEQGLPVPPGPHLDPRDERETLQDLADLGHHLERRARLGPEAQDQPAAVPQLPIGLGR